MGERPGERRFPGHPQPAGVEIESYSAYTPGDDLRHLDWNAIGRLDTLARPPLHGGARGAASIVLLDASASMDAPPDGRQARERARAASRRSPTSASRPSDAVPRDAARRRRDASRPRRSIASAASTLAIAELLAATAVAGTLQLGDALRRLRAPPSRGRRGAPDLRPHDRSGRGRARRAGAAGAALRGAPAARRRRERARSGRELHRAACWSTSSRARPIRWSSMRPSPRAIARCSTAISPRSVPSPSARAAPTRASSPAPTSRRS